MQLDLRRGCPCGRELTTVVVPQGIESVCSLYLLRNACVGTRVVANCSSCMRGWPTSLWHSLIGLSVEKLRPEHLAFSSRPARRERVPRNAWVSHQHKHAYDHTAADLLGSFATNGLKLGPHPAASRPMPGYGTGSMMTDAMLSSKTCHALPFGTMWTSVAVESIKH